jgi:hypothetical protein
MGSTLEIFNNHGQLVYSQPVSGKNVECSLPSMVSGLYRVRLLSGNGKSLGVKNLAIGK